MIDKLLRLAQLEQLRELEAPTALKLGELFADLEQALAPQALRRQIRMSFSVEPTLQITGDRFLLSLALTNLLQNALDFSPVGGKITCTASAGATQVSIRVQDQGPGIADYAHERLFERFFSLPRPDGAPKSTGLGLALVREIATLHGGRILLENSEAGGAIASLTLPL